MAGSSTERTSTDSEIQAGMQLVAKALTPAQQTQVGTLVLNHPLGIINEKYEMFMETLAINEPVQIHPM